MSEKDFRLAEPLLQQTQDLFKDTEKLSRRYEKHATLGRPTSDALVVYNEQDDLNSQDLQLHSQLLAIASRRQKSTSLVRRARWALYEKKKHDDKIRDLTEFVDKLVDLFPGVNESQMSLCKDEPSTTQDPQDLAKLKVIGGANNQVFQSYMESLLAHRSHIITD